jgi:hypothetical protein
MSPLVKLLFIAAFFFIFFVAIVMLKPMSFHSKRKISTALLKFSYLSYLAIFLIFAYFFMFYGGNNFFNMSHAENSENTMHFSMMIMAFFVPNLGIMIRKRIKMRSTFNSTMSTLNIGFMVYLWFLIELSIQSI